MKIVNLTKLVSFIVNCSISHDCPFSSLQIKVCLVAKHAGTFLRLCSSFEGKGTSSSSNQCDPAEKPSEMFTFTHPKILGLYDDKFERCFAAKRVHRLTSCSLHEKRKASMDCLEGHCKVTENFKSTN